MAGYLVSIELNNASDVIDVQSLQELAEQVMGGEAVAEDRALAVVLTDDAELRRLNQQFRGIDKATDVLSFPDEASADFVGSAAALGDIAISLETAVRQAAESGRAVELEIRHLLVHGLLHLCAYDHEGGPGEAERMRAREEHYLGDLSAFHDEDEPD